MSVAIATVLGVLGVIFYLRSRRAAKIDYYANGNLNKDSTYVTGSRSGQAARTEYAAQETQQYNHDSHQYDHDASANYGYGNSYGNAGNYGNDHVSYGTGGHEYTHPYGQREGYGSSVLQPYEGHGQPGYGYDSRTTFSGG